jgi:hypothetical protein
MPNRRYRIHLKGALKARVNSPIAPDAVLLPVCWLHSARVTRQKTNAAVPRQEVSTRWRVRQYLLGPHDPEAVVIPHRMPIHLKMVDA